MEDKGSAGYGSAPSNPGKEPAPAAPVCGASGRGMVPQVMSMTAVDTAGGGVPAAGAGSMAIVAGGSGDLSVKKKRGRPRKYDSDGNLRVPYVSTTPPPPGFTFSPPSSEFSSKKGRGRPPGSGNWQLLASLGELFANTAGGDFTPHVVTVNTGEDVAAKILSFSQKGPRGICVLSANGAVSNVTIRQPGSSGGLLTYEGRFEILSLSGSFTISENGGVRSRTGGLSVSLAGPDGRVIGGGIAGLLMAASPIQMVVGSFMPNGFKAHKRKHQHEPRTTPAALGSPDMVTQATPISQAAPASSFSPLPASHFSVHGHGEADNSIDKHNINSTPDSAEWNDLEPASPQRPSPDINVSVLVD